MLFLTTSPLSLSLIQSLKGWSVSNFYRDSPFHPFSLHSLLPHLCMKYRVGWHGHTSIQWMFSVALKYATSALRCTNARFRALSVRLLYDSWNYNSLEVISNNTFKYTPPSKCLNLSAGRYWHFGRHCHGFLFCGFVNCHNYIEGWLDVSTTAAPCRNVCAGHGLS
jgi:hypothetical protein